MIATEQLPVGTEIKFNGYSTNCGEHTGVLEGLPAVICGHVNTEAYEYAVVVREEDILATHPRDLYWLHDIHNDHLNSFRMDFAGWYPEVYAGLAAQRPELFRDRSKVFILEVNREEFDVVESHG